MATKPTIKNKLNSIVQWVILLGVFGGIFAAVFAWGEWKNIMQERMFKDSEERILTQQMVARPYSEYKNMQKADSLLMQQKDLNAAFDTINKRYINDEEDKKSRVNSRAKRDTLLVKYGISIEDIQREQRIISNAVQLILQKLDTTQ